ncbi:MAG: Rrf2 family transcriptional regulator, partial [Candidatus Margulisiibacteriota bacterium]
IPVKFLEQILTVLKRGKIIESSRGREGGYSLLKEPKEITLYDLIELMEGAVDFTANIKKGDTIINRIKEVENKLITELKKITVEDLIEEKAKETGVLLYNI